MKKYIVRVNCTSWNEIEFEALNKEEAEKKALQNFPCDFGDVELCELVSEKKI